MKLKNLVIQYIYIFFEQRHSDVLKACMPCLQEGVVVAALSRFLFITRTDPLDPPGAVVATAG